MWSLLCDVANSIAIGIAGGVGKDLVKPVILGYSLQ
jgi:hypothetical protein